MKEPIIIPSKNIFSLGNQKVIDNFADGSSFSSTNVYTNKKKNVFSAYQQQLYEAKSGTSQYTEYADKFSEINGSGIRFSGTTHEYIGYPTVTFRIIINSSNFIHVPSVRYNLTLNYIYGSDYTLVDSELQSPAVQVNPYIKKTPSYVLNDAEIEKTYTVSGTVFGQYVPAPTITSKFGTYDEKSKSVLFYITIPRWYNSSKSNPNPLMAGQTVVFTDFSIDVSADEIEFKDVEITTGEEPRVKLNSNELFQEFSENGIGDQPKGVYLYGDTLKSATKHLAEKISEDYKNGKETATIRCSISDYYCDVDREGYPVISPNKIDYFYLLDTQNPKVSKGTGWFFIPEDNAVGLPNVVNVELDAGKYSLEVIARESNVRFMLQVSKKSEIDFNDTQNELARGTFEGATGSGLIGVTTFEIKEKTRVYLHIVNDNQEESDFNIRLIGNSNKMSFDIGDIVIPKRRSEFGYDEAISKTVIRQQQFEYEVDKHFRVVGIKFIYDGAVWQELTLQETKWS